MILIIGGLAAGKRAYARDVLGYPEEAFSADPASDAPVLCDLQQLSGLTADDLAHKEVILCNEVGCGLVPVDPAQRARREETGRLLIELARRAEKVIRVVCGIGTVIKG